MTRRTLRAALLAALGAACARQTPQAAPDPRILVGRPPAPDAGARTGPAEYDIVIRNGRVLDGAGNPWILADVAIKDGKFARIGHVTARGAREIEARGLYVSPGWIDVMDQSGAALRRNGLAENKLKMGVTTAIGGEGGFPVSATDIPHYFATLEQQGISINFGSYYSQTQARQRVMQMSAAKPNAEQLDGMKASMDTAMRAGAFGMTTALIYPPSSFTTTDELVEVAKVAARYGGIYASHIRGEGKEVVQSVREVIAIAERAGLPGEVFHLKVAYRPGWGVLMDSVRQTIEAARARGVDVAADMYVYTAGGTGLEATVPSWAFEGGADSLRARLARPEVRARLKQELQTGSPGWWNIIEAAGGWDGVVLANARNPAYTKYHGRSLSEIARELGKDPADAAWDLVMQGAGRVTAIYHMMSESDVETALKFPWTSIGSDAGSAVTQQTGDDIGLPHPRAYGNHVRVISRYVKERGTLTLEQAVRKMTSWPATRFRLANRGAIVAGHWADVTIFNLDTLNDQATYQNPLASPTGIEYVIVNGALTIDRGQHTNARAGQVLYGPGRTGQ
jgi:N-acyl-D-aspartate/D-glutamate deacylase